jgi:hypothetical protein
MTGYGPVKRWRKKNPEKVAAQARRYRAKHPDKIRLIKERYRQNGGEDLLLVERVQARERRAADPDAVKRSTKTYAARLQAKRERIAGRRRATECEVCQAVEPTVYDHDHEHGLFRGWICQRCNKVLGLVYDKPGLLRNLAEYLEAHNGKINSEGEKVAAEIGVCGSGADLSGSG